MTIDTLIRGQVTHMSKFMKRYLIKYKHTANNVLEIGVMEGGSIELWSKYFTKATICGVDIDFTNDKCNLKNLKNVKLINTNAYSVEAANTLPNFDVIIDDGPHTLESMLVFASVYANKLEPNGICILEDVPNIGWIHQILSTLPKHMQKNAVVHDRRHIKNRGDDIMIVAYNN